MAFLHCHTKGCGWSQDDFYSSTYNPKVKKREAIKWLVFPRMIRFDREVVRTIYPELHNYTGIPVHFTKNNRCFSWSWLRLELVKINKSESEMCWKTYEEWRKDMDLHKAVCPRCGLINFDID